MKPICVMGNGQLGQMLRQAGDPLGISVYPIGIYDALESIPYQESIITAEIECWPKNSLTYELARMPNFVNRDIFPQLTDRLLQKKILDSLSLRTATWRLLRRREQWPKLFNELGDCVIVKCRTGGYDGRGQWRITPKNLFLLPVEIYGHAIVEQVISFSEEVSLIGARSINGTCVFYPITYNLHQDGILRVSIAFHEPNKKLQHQAELMLSTIMTTLNYIGVMAMECFILNNTLLINELAPRVHNSGHWTQNGASISQFELHLRAILNLPIPTPNTNAISVMINLIDTALNPAWLSLPLIQLHWYKKDLRPRRKLGHLNLCSRDCQTINDSLNKILSLLPKEYSASINLAKHKISTYFTQEGSINKKNN
ncbi:MAG: 5-(carboxyamino)imidazole ribonucleotide synthase [Candidatus Arsenophonus melophagi]|nr:5-(carboxyamino)imidazole ribonucleotide synthase [Candidatus Arsenophonus melophagi]